MRIRISRGDAVMAEVNSQAAVASYLGWSKKRVAKCLKTGESYDGVTVEAVGNDRRGYAVVAYTPTSSERYNSKSECARVYGISRSKLEHLISTGGTAEDGVTTFDEPIY